jgi:multicomponent K+:H+ antiporter subunit D
MADLAVKVAVLPQGDTALLRVGAMLLLLVFAIKGALVPLQFWLPGTYAAAPGPVAALFAVMTKVGAYAVIRVYTLIFPPTTAAIGPMIGDILLPAALVTLVIGAIGVLGAGTLARLVAFAAIASMGTLFTAVALFTPQGTAAALYYLLHSTFATAILFLLADLVLSRRTTGTLRQALPPMAQGGLLAALFFAGAIALAGMPPLSGFVGKLLILQAAGDHVATVWPVILATSLLMIVGFAAAGSTLFWKAQATPRDLGPEPPPAAALPFVAVFGLAACLVALTVFAGPVLRALEATSAELYAPAPYIAANALPAQD